MKRSPVNLSNVYTRGVHRIHVPRQQLQGRDQRGYLGGQLECVVALRRAKPMVSLRGSFAALQHRDGHTHFSSRARQTLSCPAVEAVDRWMPLMFALTLLLVVFLKVWYPEQLSSWPTLVGTLRRNCKGCLSGGGSSFHTLNTPSRRGEGHRERFAARWGLMWTTQNADLDTIQRG